MSAFAPSPEKTKEIRAEDHRPSHWQAFPTPNCERSSGSAMSGTWKGPSRKRLILRIGVCALIGGVAYLVTKGILRHKRSFFSAQQKIFTPLFKAICCTPKAQLPQKLNKFKEVFN